MDFEWATFTNVPAGIYNVVVYVDGMGFAAFEDNDSVVK